MLNEIFGTQQANEYSNPQFPANEFAPGTPSHESPSANSYMPQEVWQESPLGADEIHETGMSTVGHPGYGMSQELYEWETGSGMTVEQEVTAAAELMNVQSEAELDQFIGRLIKRVARVLPIPNPVPFLGALRKVASRALPTLAGTVLGGPLGGIVGGMAGKALGLEVQGMTQDEQNFELARQFIRFANDSARRVATLSRGNPRAHPLDIARNAMFQAAERYAPHLLGEQYETSSPATAAPVLPPATAARRGVWVRRGRVIVIYGA